MPEMADNPALRQKVSKLFEFLKAYIDLKYPPIRNINDQLGALWLDDLPDHLSVELHRSVDANDEEPSEESAIVLRLTRPSTTECPRPSPALAEWLRPGWRDINGAAEVHPTRNKIDGRGRTVVEGFGDDYGRSVLFDTWRKQREQWVINERPARDALKFFQVIYEWYGSIEREGERIELLVGDGLLKCAHPAGEFHHPVLLQRLELEFYPEKERPQFVFRKREQPPELYLEFLRALPNANLGQLGRCADELKKAEFAPLGDDDTTSFLRRLIQGLFPPAGSLRGDPKSIATPPDPTIVRSPVIFMRNRRTGPGNVFDLILEDIANRTDFSPALLQMLGIVMASAPGSAPVSAPAGAPKSISRGNEDRDVLFGKPANKEQLEIAKQLARRDCVVVQGPPGTGKTHTIANMLGHLLAQGKRVLVTAHTPKALKVLRQKVVEEIQPLCVSVLHNDRQSQDELQVSVRKIHVRLSEDAAILERDVERIRAERIRLLEALASTRRELLQARQDEIRAVVFSGKSVRPIDAAKTVKSGLGAHDWIPSPVKLGEAMPLSHAETVGLYQSNARIPLEDERELASFRFDLSRLPTPREFREAIEESQALAAENLRFREELWEPSISPGELAEFDRMLDLANSTIEFLRSVAPWELEAIQAGRDGSEARRVWESLIELIETAWRETHECNAIVMEHGPEISDAGSPHDLLALVDEVIEHSKSGGSFGLLTKITKRHWFEFREKVRVANRPLSLENAAHLSAVRASLRIQQLRSDLCQRWDRQMAPKGAIGATQLGERPEQACRQFVPLVKRCLEWHDGTWRKLEAEMERVGFRCAVFLETSAPEPGDHAELRRLRRAVAEELEAILQARSGFLRYNQLMGRIEGWRSGVRQHKAPAAKAAHNLRQAVIDGVPSDYERHYGELLRLRNLETEMVQRSDLISKLARGAPAWASAIENRLPLHATAKPPGEPEIAWEWRQLHGELEKRAAISLDQLQQRAEHLSDQVLDATSRLIEKQTWLFQIRQTGMTQKQALGAYAALRNKLTKTGKGVKDAEIRAAARREMAVAKDAVPVWIMPLAEVAETFDPRKTRFDVVIIDEASQCDPAALFALYMARQSIVVGDDEQVTPVAVGVEAAEVMKLIRIFLEGVPHKELYDGDTSIYELAQIAFGGVIRLTEHFRCAPDIIAFSNNLSYKGEIKPLREASVVSVRPHVVPYRVRDGYQRRDNVNEAEADAIAALICAATRAPQYAKNDLGAPATFGVVSLLGAQQALRIDTILRQRLEPAEYRRRQILCGDSAQFQGDERDVMFLSVVDGPAVSPPLTMRQEGPKKIFKKRYNVAASRARNQMWVVYSLDPQTDLQMGDYRRRLIEHAIDPGAWEREVHQRLTKVDPRSTAFEGPVLRRLLDRGFNVLPQYQVGAYSIDLVVFGGNSRLAIECDGEQFHGPERLEEDLERQAILERLGWKFVRIRSSLFFRDEERALSPVFQRLHDLGIKPELSASTNQDETSEDIQKVIRMADALRKQWRSEAGDNETADAGDGAEENMRHGKSESSEPRGEQQEFFRQAPPPRSFTSGGRRLTIRITDGSIRQNLLPLTEHIAEGKLRVGEVLKITTSAGDKFVTDVVEQGKKLRARGEIAQFYRKAAVQPGDFVCLDERTAGTWFLSKESSDDHGNGSAAEDLPAPVPAPVARGPASLRDIIGR